MLNAYTASQKVNVFNFEPILAAIKRASAEQVQTALNLTGAGFKRGDEAEAAAELKEDLRLVAKLNDFRGGFENHALAEKIFNPQHLLQVLKLYAKNYLDLTNGQCDLLWRQIIGFVQRFSPTCDAQVWAQGIYCIAENGENLGRSLKFRDNNHLSFFPLSVGAVGLGFEFAAGVSELEMGRADYCDVWPGPNSARVGHLISSKNSRFGKLMQNNSGSSLLSPCVVL